MDKGPIRQLLIHFKIIARATNFFIQALVAWNFSPNKNLCLNYTRVFILATPSHVQANTRNNSSDSLIF